MAMAPIVPSVVAPPLQAAYATSYVAHGPSETISRIERVDFSGSPPT